MRLTVFACPRANLTASRLPAAARLVDVPCAGRITTALLLDTLARGSDGVLVLGRQQTTCRLNGAEDPAQDRCEAVDAALRVIGLGGRVLFCDSHSGADGAQRTVSEQLELLEIAGPLPFANGPPPTLERGEGIDRAVATWRWLREQMADVDYEWWLDANCLPRTGSRTLVINELPILSLLGGDLWRPVSVPTLTAQAIDLLEALGLGPIGVGAVNLGESITLVDGGAGATSIADLLRDGAGRLRRANGAAVACDGGRDQTALLAALGYQPIDLGADPLPARFALGPDDRRRADAHLEAAEAAGAAALLVTDPEALLRWALLTRHGAWRMGRVRPLLPHQLAWLSWRDVPLTYQATAQTLPASEATP